VPYHAPLTESITNKVPAPSKTIPDYRGIPARQGVSFNFNQDILIVITAILCILYGFGRSGELPFRILPMITSGAIFTIGGSLSVGKSLVCLGILIFGGKLDCVGRAAITGTRNKFLVAHVGKLAVGVQVKV
jgi:hypothetical protein